MSSALLPLSLNGIFDRTFHLLGRTLLRNLVIACLFILPGAAVFTWGFQILVGGIGELLHAGLGDQGLSFSLLEPLLAGIAMFLLIGIAFFVLQICAYLGAMYVVASEMAGQPVSWSGALQAIFDGRMLKAVVQAVLQLLAIFGLLIVPYGLFIAGAAAHEVWLALLALPLYLAALAVIVYFVIMWLFAQPAIAWEDVGIFESFGRSGDLVYGHWWRTLGIYLLMSIVAGLAISLISTPISFVAMWGFVARYMDLIQSIQRQTEPSLEQIFSLLSSIGIGSGVLIAVNGILQVVTMPVYLVVMYFDLRARRGEFPVPSDPVDPQYIRPLG